MDRRQPAHLRPRGHGPRPHRAVEEARHDLIPLRHRLGGRPRRGPCWAAENGHLAAPTDATYRSYRVGSWLKNARAAARKAQENVQRRAEGLPVESSAGALPEERREQPDDIDPAWCPA
ncbi:Helicase associated domain protein [Streptomyces collinus]|uniref:Helicase associated domain protein n=1 Tax=Streptomyces collinus TaxID=42684 RepID=UPI003698AD08